LKPGDRVHVPPRVGCLPIIKAFLIKSEAPLREAPMSCYRAYFFDEGSRITSDATLDSRSDAEAVEVARSLLRLRADCKDFELWDEARPIRILPRTRDGHLAL
jgi:hypothetical protein